MRVGHSSAAGRDVLQIVEYYNRESGPDLAADILAEFDACIDRIAIRPESFPMIFRDFRSASLNRFPYQVLFRMAEGSKIRILVVRQGRRHPSFGTRRR